MQLQILAITGRAVWFVLANLFTLFRLNWLPIVLLVGAQWLVAYAVAWASPGATFEAASETWIFAGGTWTTLLLQGIALSVVAVAVHRIILFGDKRPGHYFGFPFGRTELLYALMGVLTVVFIFALVIALFAGVAIAGAMTLGESGGPVLDALTEGRTDDVPDPVLAVLGLAAFVGYIALVWLSLRLAVWPPAVVANDRLALGEAWGLTKGQVFAMFGLLLLSTFVVLVPMAAVSYLTAGVGVTPNEALPFAPFDANVKYALAHPASAPDPNMLLIAFAMNFLFATYTIAVLSYAYKALKGFDPDLPIDAQDGLVGYGGFQPAGAH
jgi:hypothetical protein